MRRRKNQKVIKMKRRNSYALGIFLCLFAVYVLVLFFQSFTKEHVSIYEVNQKQIADNENLRGIVLRNESLVKARQDGFVNYYVGEGSKLSASTTVYSVSQQEQVGDVAASVDTNAVKLSEDDTRNIRNTIANFRDGFNLSDYQQMLSFRYNIQNTLLELSDISLAENLSKIKQESGSGVDFKLERAEKTGIVSFATDGLEDLTIDTLKPDHFKEMTDKWKQLRSDKEIQKGKPVYRVVTDEKWSIVVSLDREQYAKLLKKDMVLVKIKKDNMQLTPTVRTYTSDGGYYANLVFDKYMIHYLNNRYLDIEIQFDNADGLKIPISSIVKKKCYVLPQEYITKGGKSNREGIAVITYKKDGTEQLDFIPAEVYFRDEDGNAYIDAGIAEPGTHVLKKESGSDRIQLTDIKELQGVYNCNQGYCRFRYIHMLYKNQEYAIIENGNSYSLSNYDHIVLNPDKINEDEVIY